VDNSEVIHRLSTGYPQVIPSTNKHKKKVIHRLYYYYYLLILYNIINSSSIKNGEVI